MFFPRGRTIVFVPSFLFAVLILSTATAQPGFQGNQSGFQGRPPNGMIGNPGPNPGNFNGNPNPGNAGGRPPNFNPGPGNVMGNGQMGVPGNAMGNPNMGMAGNAIGNPKMGMPGATPPGAGAIQEWQCTSCKRVVGTGPTPPKIDVCPYCQTRIGYYEDASGKHDMPDTDDTAKTGKILKTVLGVLAGVGVVVGIIVGIVKGSGSSKPKKRKRKRIRDDDDLPRKRVRDDDDERPRSTRSPRDD